MATENWVNIGLHALDQHPHFSFSRQVKVTLNGISMLTRRIYQVVKKPDTAVIGILIAIVAILAGARSVHYLLFHTMAELFAIVVSLSIFMLTWTSNRYLANGYLIVLGGAYGAIGIVDVFHTLTFRGMNLFPGVSTNYPTQFWLTARYLEALALVCGPLFIIRKPNFFSVSAGFAAIAFVACVAVMYQLFPATFIDGVGLTPFKIYSEYVIIAMLLLGLILLYRSRHHFEPKIFFLLVVSLWLAVATEFCFTRYAGFYDFINELGHYFRFLSVALAFIAIVLSGVRQPLELIFREMDEQKRKLDVVNENLTRSETKLKNQINLLSTLLKNLPVGVFMVEVPSGRPLVANDAAVHLLGRGILPDVSRENIAEVYKVCKLGSHDPYPPEELPIVRGMDGVTSHVDDMVVERPDGTKSLLEVFGSPVKDEQGQVWASLVSFSDITQRKQVESEIRRSNSELEQFSYAISHDLRQPLRMISSYMTLLENDLADQLDSEKREYFNFAINGAKRLDQMMVGLLEYSRIGRKGEPPVWVESRSVVDEALLFLQPAISEAQAQVHIEGEWPGVFVSPDEMTRLVQNLIGNALKFRIAGRTPEVIVTSGVSDNEWRLSVADNGIGIIPDQIGRLFQVFQRLQGRTAFEGNGIGLALCRKIAEHHRGRIWVESAGEGQGSRFCIALPQERK
ncbi:MAG: MASE3 domain-containing protein [Sterolibacterium sp.]